MLSKLCENLDALDEPDAKAAMVWIIGTLHEHVAAVIAYRCVCYFALCVGEYAERIPNAEDFLETFLSAFEDEPAIVRQQVGVC